MNDNLIKFKNINIFDYYIFYRKKLRKTNCNFFDIRSDPDPHQKKWIRLQNLHHFRSDLFDCMLEKKTRRTQF